MMSKYPINMLEEELKNKVAADWFSGFDTTRIIGKVDFCVVIPATELALYEPENALWAEAKAGVRKGIRKFFQGTKKTASGKEQMNPTSDDEVYNAHLAKLRSAMKHLARQIEPKVYEYGFLKR